MKYFGRGALPLATQLEPLGTLTSYGLGSEFATATPATP